MLWVECAVWQSVQPDVMTNVASLSKDIKIKEIFKHSSADDRKIRSILLSLPDSLLRDSTNKCLRSGKLRSCEKMRASEASVDKLHVFRTCSAISRQARRVSVVKILRPFLLSSCSFPLIMGLFLTGLVSKITILDRDPGSWWNFNS